MATLTFANVETRVANRLRLPTTNSTEMTKLDAVINDVYREIASKFVWPWLLKRQLINTVAPYETGTVSVTKSSTTATLSATATPTQAEKTFHVPSNDVENAIYRISAHTDATDTLTLASAYTGSTAAAAAYKIWSDEYDLASDVGEVRWVRRAGWRLPMVKLGPERMQHLKGHDRSEGPPQYWAVYDFDTTGDPTTVPQLVIHPFPDDTYQLEIHYKRTLNTEVSSSTRLLIPDDYLHVIEWGTLSLGYPIFLNDAARGQYFHQKYVDALNLMVAQHRSYDDNPGVEPADVYRGFYRSRRVTPATADLGSTFDRWPA